MVYLTRRVARTPLAPTDPGYNPIDERRPPVLFSDWTPKNLQPHEENVEVYSNCEEVELFLNGKSLGKQARPGDDSPRNWRLSFAPGTLRAVGMNRGRVAATYELRTARQPAQLIVTADKNTIADTWDDVVFVNVSVVDDSGTLVPDADNLMTFTSVGAGFIAAVDSADNNSHESYQASQRRAYQGMCLAMIKTNSDRGSIKLTASSPNLKSASLELRVLPASGRR